MDDVTALHTLVRRYCEERGQTCWEGAEYAAWHALTAILAEVERFTPGELGTLAEARGLLAAAAATAESDWTRHLAASAPESVAAERELLALAILNAGAQDLARVPPMAYRRTLTAAEGAGVRTELQRTWGTDGYWFPLDRYADEPPPAHTVAFDDAPFASDALQQTLRDVLASGGVTRVLELREYDRDTEDKEIELALLTPYCGTGGEGFWLDRSYSWLIYASHEETLTIGGRELLAALQAAWPAWRDHVFSYPV